MTGKIHFKLATFYIFSKLYFVSGFGFVAQFFKLRFYQSYQCRNNCMCSHFFVQMLEKMVTFQILLPLLVWEQNSTSCPFRFCISWLY